MTWDFIQAQVMRNMAAASQRIIDRDNERHKKMMEKKRQESSWLEQLKDSSIRHAIKQAAEYAASTALVTAAKEISKATGEPFESVMNRLDAERHRALDVKFNYMQETKYLRHDPRTTNRIYEEIDWYKK